MANKVGEKRKTLTLSLRLDPKMRFALEFASRIKGQSITTFVERAIEQAAKEVYLEESNSLSCRNWRAFWSADEGMRTLRLMSDFRYPITYEEDELQTFVIVHKDFFYSDSEAAVPCSPHAANASVLWPFIEKFHSIWRETKSIDPWAARRAMAEALREAKLEPPEWTGDFSSPRKAARRRAGK